MLNYPGLYETTPYGPSIETLRDEVEQLQAKIKDLDEELTQWKDEAAYWQARAKQQEDNLSALDEYRKDGNF